MSIIITIIVSYGRDIDGSFVILTRKPARVLP